jgi:hypothetical protein
MQVPILANRPLNHLLLHLPSPPSLPAALRTHLEMMTASILGMFYVARLLELSSELQRHEKTNYCCLCQPGLRFTALATCTLKLECSTQPWGHCGHGQNPGRSLKNATASSVAGKQKLCCSVPAAGSPIGRQTHMYSIHSTGVHHMQPSAPQPLQPAWMRAVLCRLHHRCCCSAGHLVSCRPLVVLLLLLLCAVTC